MRRLIVILVFVSAIYGQTTDLDPRKIWTGTVGTLPTASSYTDKIAVVTDGTTTSDCVTGGSSHLALCISTGSAWTSLGGSSGSSALSGITAATATNTIANGNNSGQVWNWALTSNSVTAFTFGETSAATGTSDKLIVISTAAGSTAIPLSITDSLTGSQTIPAANIGCTWNTTGVVDACFFVNVTNTASGAASLVADLQVGGSSVFKVDKTGLMTVPAGIVVGTAPSCTAGTSGALCFGEGTGPTTASSVDQAFASSTFHDWAFQSNGGSAKLAISTAGSAKQTAQTGAISTATLCAASAGACNQAGMYHVHWSFTETGTACGTPGTGGVTFLLTWTDQNGTAHSAIQLPMDDGSALNAVSGTFHFQTSLAAAWASGDFNIDSNGSIVQYATGFTACSVGTGAYTINAAVTRLQ